jgi:hypothetical protein
VNFVLSVFLVPRVFQMRAAGNSLARDGHIE